MAGLSFIYPVSRLIENWYLFIKSTLAEGGRKRSAAKRLETLRLESGQGLADGEERTADENEVAGPGRFLRLGKTFRHRSRIDAGNSSGAAECGEPVRRQGALQSGRDGI